MKGSLLFAALAFAPWVCALAFAGGPVSRMPLDVVLDYNYYGGHLHNGAGAPLYPLNPDYWPRFAEELRQAPPDLLIVGKEAPFTHSMGPIASYGGENQTFPRLDGKDARSRLSPEQLRLKIAAIQKFIDEAHKSGVKRIAPYVSLITMFGDAEKRNGFWEFYDHWDEYAKEFDLGPRPATDPIEWCQRDPEGKVYFKWGPHKPHYEPFTRYTVCANNPDWQQWARLFTRWIARCGYDGLWIDNAVEQRCYCRYCQALAKELGSPLAPPSRALTDQEKMTRNRAAQAAWLQGHLRLWDDLRREGERIRPGFQIYVNYIELPNNADVTEHAELCMIEHCWLGVARLVWPGGLWAASYPAMPDIAVLNNRTRPCPEPHIFDNIWAHQLSFAMRGGRGVHWLYGAPAKGDAPAFEHNADSALLALAEAAAFGGGNAVGVTTGDPYSKLEFNAGATAARKKFFKDFLPRHRELYEGLRPAGDVAILVFPNQRTEWMIAAQRIHEALQWRGALCAVFDGDRVQPEALRGFAHVIVPGQPVLPDGMAKMDLIRDSDPVTESDCRAVTDAYQHKKPIPPLRETAMMKLCRERLAPEVAIFGPEVKNVQAALWAGDGRLVLHVLNYAVPIGRGNEGKVEPVRNLQIRLRLPAQAARITAVRAWSPGRAGAVDLKFTQERDRLVLTLPLVGVYEACEIRI